MVHPLPRGAAPHLINIIIILIMLWVRSRAPANWWSLIKRVICWHLGGWGDRGGCSRLLRAAGGAWQQERARPGRDHCDTPMDIFTTAVRLICIFYEAVTDAVLFYCCVSSSAGWHFYHSALWSDYLWYGLNDDTEWLLSQLWNCNVPTRADDGVARRDVFFERLVVAPQRHNNTSEMKYCDADGAVSGKRTYQNMPGTISNPHILRC